MSVFIFIGVMLLIFAIVAVLAIRRGLEMKRLAQEGQAAKARIVHKARVRAGKGRHSETFTYEFQDSFGQTQRRRIHVSRSIYDQYEEGSPFDIVYLLDNPKISGAKYMVDEISQALAKRGR